jgi:hypothetical protein
MAKVATRTNKNVPDHILAPMPLLVLYDEIHIFGYYSSGMFGHKVSYIWRGGILKIVPLEKQ